jgi:hypothetical protein
VSCKILIHYKNKNKQQQGKNGEQVLNHKSKPRQTTLVQKWGVIH